MSDDAPSDPVPAWLGRVVLVGAALATGLGLVGLPLAIAGHWHPAPAWGAGSAVAAVVVLLGWRSVGTGTGTAASSGGSGRAGAWAFATLVLVAVVAGAGAPHLSEHVVVDSDPGVYRAAADWLRAEGTLVVPGPEEPFLRVGFGTGFPGLFEADDESLTFQFVHLLPVLLAAGGSVAGDPGTSAVPSVLVALGLLGLHVVAARAARRAWAGTLAVAVVAVSLPVLVVARDTFSEAAVLGLLWPALALAGGSWRRTDPAGALAAGLVLGVAVGARIDGAALAVLLPPLLAALGRRRGAAWPVALAVGLLPGVVVAVVDLVVRSPDYLADQGPRAGALVLAVAASAGLTLAWAVVDRPRRTPLVGARAAVVLAVAVAVAAAVGVAAVLRPRFAVRAPGERAFVATLQRAEGQVVDQGRTYAEQAPVWLLWYLGLPVLFAAVAGLGVLVHRLLRGRLDTATTLALAVALPAAALYLWRPSITPYQLWATRRFVPVAIPLLALLAAVATAALAAAVAGRARSRRAPGVVVAVVAVALVAPVGARTWPLRDAATQVGFSVVLDQLCAAVGDAAVVVLDADQAATAVSQGVRQRCAVPVAVVGARAEREASLRATARRWEAAGRELVLLGSSEATLTGVLPSLTPTRVAEVVDPRRPVPTLSRPPDETVLVERDYWLAVVTPG